MYPSFQPTLQRRLQYGSSSGCLSFRRTLYPLSFRFTLLLLVRCSSATRMYNRHMLLDRAAPHPWGVTHGGASGRGASPRLARSTFAICSPASIRSRRCRTASVCFGGDERPSRRRSCLSRRPNCLLTDSLVMSCTCSLRPPNAAATNAVGTAIGRCGQPHRVTREAAQCRSHADGIVRHSLFARLTWGEHRTMTFGPYQTSVSH